jgi:hypothetical protein
MQQKTYGSKKIENYSYVRKPFIVFVGALLYVGVLGREIFQT